MRADGIAHFVSNSPFLSFLYKTVQNEVTNDKGVLVKEYTLYKTLKGKMVAKISNGIKPMAPTQLLILLAQSL